MSPAPRVCTVTLNPAIDLTAAVPDLTPGAVNRVLWDQEDPGGKGVNVASFLASAGVAVTATGLRGRDNDGAFRALFAAKGIEDRFVPVAGRTRTNVKLIDEERGAAGVTDINFPGFSATHDDLERLSAILEELAADHEWFVLSGSLPGDVPPDIYRRIIQKLRARGRRTVLDTSGSALAAALEAAPHVIKPNEDELSELLGRPVRGPPAAMAAARDLHRRGVETVIVSMGAEGALFSESRHGQHAVMAVPPRVAVRSTVGAGDAMVAGYVAAALRGLSLPESARLATAFSLGTLTTLGPRLPPMADVEAGAAEVRVDPVDP